MIRLNYIFKFTLVIGFLLTSNIFGQTKLIATGDTWKYYDQEQAPTQDWNLSESGAQNWKEGISPLGYGSKLVATKISFGDNPKKKHITKYFKKTILIEDPYMFLYYKLNVQRDDGVVIYINGNEVFRNNMPNNKIDHNTTASALVFSSSLSQVMYSEYLSPEVFVSGKNIISASVHQARKKSSDCVFNLELIGDNSPEMIPLLIKEQTVKNLNRDLKLSELNHELQIEKKENELERVKEAKYQLKVMLFLSVFLLIASILGFLFFRKKFQTETTQFQTSLKNTKEQLITKDREMISTSLSLIHNQQSLKELKANLTDLLDSNTLTALKKSLKQITKQIDFSIENEEEWENLKKHFSSVYSGFLGNLMKKHPTLSDTELRHCAFIKLHMQTKEIARILNIDPKSVQASRYRMKKKMNLSEDQDLKTYIQEFK